MARLMQRRVLTGVAILVGAALVRADEPAPEIVPEDAWRETIKVEREERETPKHPTLRFLDENRDFFRGRLDQLLVRLDRERDGSARPIDPRYLRYQDMMAAIKAARDSAEVSEEWIRRRELLASVGDLIPLEQEMDEMETLLEQQRGRLVQIEEDFIGRQTTALVVLLTGVPASGIPETVVLRESGGESVRIALPEEARIALERGGSTQLYHEFVEPRELVLAVSFEGANGSASVPYEVTIEPERDRLTFLELDAAGLGAGTPTRTLNARTWTR
ncbi:MAG: hypothetical protein KC591_07880 [Gemmatimonadetes bacterium]|nr:hypothetical protein [Gemmatimonadota bacterium]